MVACVLTGNISGEATNPMGNILGEAMRHSPHLCIFARNRDVRFFRGEANRTPPNTGLQASV